MDSPTEARSDNITSVKRMAIILILAFIGSQLNALGAWAILVAVFALSSSSSSFIIPLHAEPDIPAGISFLAGAFLVFWLGFLTLSLYPRRDWSQVAAGFLSAVILVIAGIFCFKYYLPLETSVGLAVAVCLLLSNKIKKGFEWVGLGMGLAIGVGLRMTILEISSLTYAPIWLSAVLFPELFSQRVSWRVGLFGVALWAGLIILSWFVSRSLYF